MYTKEDVLDKVDFCSCEHTDFDGIYKAMDEYAKQQSVAFMKWALNAGKIIGDNWGDAYMPLEEEDVYNQFIEHQKQTENK